MSILNITAETLRQTEVAGSNVVGRLWDHSPYSPRLAPSDFHLSGLLKKHLDGKRFVTDANMKQAVTSWLVTLDTVSFYHWDTILGAIIGQMLECQWWLHWRPVYTICYPCVMYGSKSEQSSWWESVCYLISETSLCLWIFDVSIKSWMQPSYHGVVWQCVVKVTWQSYLLST